MSLTIPLVAADGATSTVTLPDPVVGGVSPRTFTVGETAVLGVDGGNAGLVVGQDVTLSEPGTIQSISFYVVAVGGQAYLGLYDRTGPSGGPGALKATTAVFTPVVGWNTVNVVTPVLLPAGNYELAYHLSGALSYAAGPGGTMRWYSKTFGPLASTFSTAPATAAFHRSLYATFSTTAAPPPPGLPTIASITPNPGAAGTVTVNGTNFVALATVTFGGVAATNVSIVNSTQLTCSAPAHADGSVPVVVSNVTGVSAGFAFTYQAVAPPIPGLPPLWNASPPTGVCPAPSGPFLNGAGWDAATLAQNEIWDNFNGSANSNPDSRLWLEETIWQGGGQTYQPEHSFLDGNGNAVLEAVISGAPPVAGSNEFSGKFSALNKWVCQYGWCAARIKFPESTGTVGRSWFPAFWLLRQNYNSTTDYGEIDVMEIFGNTKLYETHLYFGSTANYKNAEKVVPANHSGGDCAGGFHTYWMLWKPDSIQIGIDDLSMGTWTAADFGATAWLSSQKPFYYILNFALDPGWLATPLASDFPARTLIDWVWYKPLNLL